MKVAAEISAMSEDIRQLRIAMDPSETLEDLLRPVAKDPDDAGHLVWAITNALDKSLAETFKTLPEKLVPIKFSAATGSVENGRDYPDGGSYSYSIQYPEHVELGYRFRINPVKRWKEVIAALGSNRKVKPGVEWPALSGPLLRAFNGLIAYQVENSNNVIPKMLSVPRLVLPDSTMDTIQEAMPRMSDYEDTARQWDEDGELMAEASEFEIDWEMTGKELKIQAEDQGGTVLVQFSLPIDISIRNVQAPGDHGWR